MIKITRFKYQANIARLGYFFFVRLVSEIEIEIEIKQKKIRLTLLFIFILFSNKFVAFNYSYFHFIVVI